MQGMLSGVFGVSAVIGPSLGAFIVQYGAWPMVFWMNLPIGAAAIVMIALFLPEHVRTPVPPRGLPGLGAAAAGDRHADAAAAGGRVVPASRWPPPRDLRAGRAALVLHERRVAEPMLPLELWRNRVIVSSSVGSLVTGTLMMGVTAYLPTYVQGNMGRGADVSAVILALMSVVWVLGSATAGLCLPRTTYRRIAVIGALALIAGAAMLIALTPARGAGLGGQGAVLIGAGMGFCNTTFMVSVQTSVSWGQRGAATSSTMFLRFLGQSLGAAVFGAVLTAGLFDGKSATADPLERLMDPHGRTVLRQRATGRLTGAIIVRHAPRISADRYAGDAGAGVGLTYPAHTWTRLPRGACTEFIPIRSRTNVVRPSRTKNMRLTLLSAAPSRVPLMLANPTYPRFLPVGDAALNVEFGDAIAPELNQAVVHLDIALAAAELDGIIETMPSYRSLLICYEPLEISFQQLVTEVRQLLSSEVRTGTPRAKRTGRCRWSTIRPTPTTCQRSHAGSGCRRKR